MQFGIQPVIGIAADRRQQQAGKGDQAKKKFDLVRQFYAHGLPFNPVNNKGAVVRSAGKPTMICGASNIVADHVAPGLAQREAGGAGTRLEIPVFVFGIDGLADDV
ncbi:hypothetical protein GCM10023078_22830 [Gibbsiella greigii]